MIKNRTMPKAAVIPELVYEDVAQAVAWLCVTFGFELRWQAGGHRAQLAVGDGAIVVSEPRIAAGSGGPADATELRPPREGAARHSVMVRIEDAQTHFEHARDRGARILKPPADYPYGERQYSVADLAGHRWTFSESIADTPPEAWGGQSGPAL
jgi:uncharacterized glyoxalase superfamily protein PhnB